MKYYLYNSLANNGIKPDIAPDTKLIDAVGMDYAEYLSKLSPEDEVVLIGGDGTLNYFKCRKRNRDKEQHLSARKRDRKRFPHRHRQTAR